jgi:hypothetical protein
MHKRRYRPDPIAEDPVEEAMPKRRRAPSAWSDPFMDEIRVRAAGGLRDAERGDKGAGARGRGGGEGLRCTVPL